MIEGWNTIHGIVRVLLLNQCTCELFEWAPHCCPFELEIYDNDEQCNCCPSCTLDCDNDR